MIKKLPKSQIGFEVAIPWSSWEKYLDLAAAEVSEELRFAGFRPGKAPRKMVEQKVGKGVILSNAAEKAIQKSYMEFVVKEKISVISNPKIEVEEIVEGKDLLYKAAVDVMPEVMIKDTYKADIKKVNVEFSKKNSEASDTEIEEELKRLANSRVKLVTVNRAAQKNDGVEIDFSVSVDGVVIDNGSSKNHPLVIGKDVFIPGFEDNLIGMSEGDEKKFELDFPKDYHKKDLSGKKAIFEVKMNLVQERQAPELNDDFAKSLGEFENLEALKKNIKEGIEHENKHKLEEARKTAYLDKIIAQTEVEIPAALLEEEQKRMLQEFEHQIQSMGMTLDHYLTQLKKDKKELEKDWEPQAEKRVKSALVMKEIVKLEDIKIDAKDIEAEMNKTMQYYKNVKDMEKNIDMERLYNYTRGILENEEVFKILEKINS